MKVRTIKKQIMFDIKNRLLFYIGLKLIQKPVKIFTRYEFKNILIYPCFSNINLLKKYIEKIYWYLPESKNRYFIHLIVDRNVPYQKLSMENHFVFHKKNRALPECDVILVHNAAFLKNSFIIKNLYKVRIIDPLFYSIVEAGTWNRIFYDTHKKKEKLHFNNVSKKNFSKLCEIHKKIKDAYCFLSGPSIENYKNYNFSKNALKIICNSLVKNRKFLEYIDGPDIITFADPVYHFSHNRYAQQFRKDMISVFNEYNPFVIVPFFNVPLILKYFPFMKDRLIGVFYDKTMQFPTVKTLSVKGTENIFTLFMITFASSIANNVYILGADGRNHTEKKFWQYASTVQYNDIINEVETEHPSFFRDRNYSKYYKKHVAIVEKFFRFGEKQGKKYYSLAPSMNPSIQKRLIKNYDIKRETQK